MIKTLKKQRYAYKKYLLVGDVHFYIEQIFGIPIIFTPLSLSFYLLFFLFLFKNLIKKEMIIQVKKMVS